MKNITFEIKYVCLECGHIFKEKQLKKERNRSIKMSKMRKSLFYASNIKNKQKKALKSTTKNYLNI